MANWTDEQLQAIEGREGNLLVAAAAEFGKTAVLVERIIQRICDEHNPVDVDALGGHLYQLSSSRNERENRCGPK